MSDTNIIAICRAIAQCHFLNTPYKDVSSVNLYRVGGVANKASGICHYCTIDTLNAILDKGCLRFTDVRFLNDSTEFIEVIPLIKTVLNCGTYSLDFRELILNSKEMRELEEYKQSYSGYLRRLHDFGQTAYHTYTCSFSTNSDSLSMWNYYATTTSGINIVFDYAWNVFSGSEKEEVNIGERLSNDIVIFRGLVLYSIADKEKCIAELLNRLNKIFDNIQNDLEKVSVKFPHTLPESRGNEKM